MHICKSWPAYFQAIKAGDKTHDMRKMDRDFKIGDQLLLQEYDPFIGTYTGDECTVEVTYITSKETPCAFSSSALMEDYCILSLKLIDKSFVHTNDMNQEVITLLKERVLVKQDHHYPLKATLH